MTFFNLDVPTSIYPGFPHITRKPHMGVHMDYVWCELMVKVALSLCLIVFVAWISSVAQAFATCTINSLYRTSILNKDLDFYISEINWKRHNL
jgi:hypothetical protein